MQTVIKVVIGKPFTEEEKISLMGKTPALIYNVVREERILHNQSEHWPGEIYLQLEASTKLLEVMEGREVKYFEVEIDDQGSMHFLPGGCHGFRETTREEYIKGAKNRALFTMN
jgi:hypothetical protein